MAVVAVAVAVAVVVGVVGVVVVGFERQLLWRGAGVLLGAVGAAVALAVGR